MCRPILAKLLYPRLRTACSSSLIGTGLGLGMRLSSTANHWQSHTRLLCRCLVVTYAALKLSTKWPSSPGRTNVQECATSVLYFAPKLIVPGEVAGRPSRIARLAMSQPSVTCWPSSGRASCNDGVISDRRS